MPNKKRSARGVSSGALWSAASVLIVAAVTAIIASNIGAQAFASVANFYNALTPSSVSFSRSATSTVSEVSEKKVSNVAHIKTPASVKAIYMSQCAAGTPSFRESLTKLIDETELNAIVIDIRDYTGKIAFPTDNPVLKDMVSDECGATDMQGFIRTLHEKNIYVIGRITVFQNPYYTKQHPEQAVQHTNGGVWKDRKGLAFVDVGAKPYWDTVVELAEESYAIGFDELNFDYIRYPSDGDMAAAVYIKRDGKTKQELLEDFFKYLHDHMPEGAVTSADLFGMTTTNTDDLNIGQVLERALPYFDYIAPMVYPSHYPKGFNGWNDVNAVTYELMKFVMAEGVRRTEATTTGVPSYAHTRIGTSTPAVYSKPAYDRNKLRPWIQDFDYPVEYTPEMVENQLRANRELGIDSYMVWDPGNKYSNLKQVVKKEE